MPILINEVIAEVEPGATPPERQQSPEARTPVTDPELQLVKMLALMEERRMRLTVD